MFWAFSWAYKWKCFAQMLLKFLCKKTEGWRCEKTGVGKIKMTPKFLTERKGEDGRPHSKWWTSPTFSIMISLYHFLQKQCLIPSLNWFYFFLYIQRKKKSQCLKSFLCDNFLCPSKILKTFSRESIFNFQNGSLIWSGKLEITNSNFHHAGSF